MKRIFVLAMVLGLASAVHGGIVLTVDGEVAGDTITANIGDTIILGAHLEASTYMAGGDFQFCGADFNLSSVTQPANYRAAPAGDEVTPGPTDVKVSSVAELNVIEPYNVVYLSGISMNIVGDQLLFDNVEATVTSLGAITLKVYDYGKISYLTPPNDDLATLVSAGTILDTLTIVPEPMTVVLLGLGEAKKIIFT